MRAKDKIRALIGTAMLIVSAVGGVMADVPSPNVGETSGEVDWFYILRGVVFIFASALAMVWLGRRFSKRSPK